MPIKENVIKGWLTTIFGVAILVITLVLIWQKVITFKWEGTIGLVIGMLFLFIRRTFLEKAIIKAIESWGKRSNSGYDNYTPPPGDA